MAAQPSGALQGTVRDVTGAPVAGARVEPTVAGRARSVGSDNAGHYRFEGLPPGAYRVVATHVGLVPVSVDVTIGEAGSTMAADLTLGNVVASEIAQAGWRIGPGDITLRGKNLTNALYVEWAVTANQVLVGMPRMFEASYQFRF